MNEIGQAALEAEAPVNPYSLLEAVNESSDTANTAWLIFLAIMAYLLVAVAGVSHKDLLLQSDIPLPVLQVKIGLTQFFLFAPIILVLFHFGVVGQLVLLARKTIEFDASLLMLEPSDARRHPLRLQLHNFFFVQAIAGPERASVMSLFLHGMTWLTLVILPVLLLLYVQIAFLPYHSETITIAHRVALFADIAMLIFIGTFLLRAETSFVSAFGRTSRQHPFSFAATAILMAAVAVFSLFVATIPDERLDLIGRGLIGARPRVAAERAEFTVPFLVRPGGGPLFGLFHRNLVATDLDLVVDKDVTPGEKTLNLRGRDLRYARLDRSDMHQADMTGVDLDGASLVKTDLRNVTLQCADIERLTIHDDRRGARCVSARNANLTGARLADARMSGADLTLARLDDAVLANADLSQTTLDRAEMSNVQADGADFTGASLYGANLLLAGLAGANLTSAKAIGAKLDNAKLQGARLLHARLEGAALLAADLDGADLTNAQLVGADLTGARIAGADLNGAFIWQTKPPQRDPAALADIADMALRPLDDGELKTLKETVRRIADPVTRGKVEAALAGVLGADGRGWAQSPERLAWGDMVTAGSGPADTYKVRLTDYLARLACRPRYASGFVATGLLRRVRSPAFKGDASAIADKLKADDCPASKTLSRDLLRDVAAMADNAKPQ